ncbi:MAG: DUF218 domain-containing protein [Shewanella sp.]|nr:DUF218 domain-containing protein [Shewanella sp.]
MLFWIKKVISQFFMPLPLIILVLLSAWLWVRYRRFTRINIAIAITIIMVLASPISNRLLVNPLESQYSANDYPMASHCTILVLGSGHNDMTELSATQQLSSVALARLVEGVRQYTLSPDCRFVVSGWHGDNRILSHAEVMAEASIELGVNPNNIIQMPLSKDTEEEAINLKHFQGKLPFRLVTSATHMPRAVAIFTKHGLTPEPAPTDFINSSGKWWQLDAKQLDSSQRAIHEHVGLAWFKIKTFFKGAQ